MRYAGRGIRDRQTAYRYRIPDTDKGHLMKSLCTMLFALLAVPAFAQGQLPEGPGKAETVKICGCVTSRCARRPCV